MGRRKKTREGTGFRPFEVVDGLETIFYGLAGLAVLGFILFRALGAAHRLGGPLALGMTVAVSVLVLGTVVRDARRRQWSPASIALAATYLFCVLALMVVGAIGD